jgi:vacuolar-type H+-ATPase subunit E/Vma4
MSVEKIIEQIKKDSEKEIKAILDEAKKQEKIIIDMSKKEAENQVEKILIKGKEGSENLKKILISKAHQDTKREIMNAREKIIEDCFTKAHSELSKLKGKEYISMVKKLIQDGYNKLGENCSIMISRDEDKIIAKELGILVDGKVESSGGVILKSSDGKILLNHTFEGILKREKNKIRIKIGKLLFS